MRRAREGIEWKVGEMGEREGRHVLETGKEISLSLYFVFEQGARLLLPPAKKARRPCVVYVVLEPVSKLCVCV